MQKLNKKRDKRVKELMKEGLSRAQAYVEVRREEEAQIQLKTTENFLKSLKEKPKFQEGRKFRSIPTGYDTSAPSLDEEGNVVYPDYSNYTGEEDRTAEILRNQALQTNLDRAELSKVNPVGENLNPIIPRLQAEGFTVQVPPYVKPLGYMGDHDLSGKPQELYYPINFNPYSGMENVRSPLSNLDEGYNPYRDPNSLDVNETLPSADNLQGRGNYGFYEDYNEPRGLLSADRARRSPSGTGSAEEAPAEETQTEGAVTNAGTGTTTGAATNRNFDFSTPEGLGAPLESNYSVFGREGEYHNPISSSSDLDEWEDPEDPQKPITLNPYTGVDIPSAAVMFGQSLQEGNTPMSILSGLKVGAGLGRNIMTGAGYSQANETQEEARKKRQREYNTQVRGYFQTGGQFEDIGQNPQEMQGSNNLSNAESLSGEYIEGVSENNQNVQANSELEGGEHIIGNQGGSVKVEGRSHSKGGEDIELQDGDRVISDHLKLGGEIAKQIRDKYGVKVKAKNTFAEAVDKVYKNIGLQDLIDKEIELIEEIENQEKEVEDEGTKNINLEFLYRKLQEIQQQKEEIEPYRQEVLNEVFALQEESKGEGAPITEEEAQQIPPEMQEEIMQAQMMQEEAQQVEGELPNMQLGGIYRIDTPIELDEVVVTANTAGNKTPKGIPSEEVVNYRGMYGYRDRTGAIKYDEVTEDWNSQRRYLEGKKKTGFREIPRENLRRMQSGGAYLPPTIQNTLRPETVRFLEDLANEETRRRALENLPIDIGTVVQGANQINSNEMAWHNVPGTEEEENLQVAPPALDRALLRMLQQIEEEKVIEEPGLEEGLDSGEDPGKSKKEREKAEKVSTLIPQYPSAIPLPPTGLESQVAIDTTYDRTRPQTVDVSSVIQRINEQAALATRSAEGLTGPEKIAFLSQVEANRQEAIADTKTKGIMQGDMFRERADQANQRVQMMEENARAANALDYERRAQTAKSITDTNLRNFFQNLQDINQQRFTDVRRMNTLNEDTENMTIDAQGNIHVTGVRDDYLENYFEMVKNNPDMFRQLLALAEEEKKKSKSKKSKSKNQ